MARALFGLVLVAAAFIIYAVVDCVMLDRARVRGLPRGVWILIILLLPVIGGILWFFVGRGRKSQLRARSIAPDDDPDFLKGLIKDPDQDERIRKLEQELSELDDGQTPPDGRPGEADPPGRRDA
ncbi:PLD nuclease N-terminal domain-containing protein [Compostimonas suwonensis]|nr:PLD nuclease N-terminal domain-containing protein [Compostimonas suwonensis]